MNCQRTIRDEFRGKTCAFGLLCAMSMLAVAADKPADTRAGKGITCPVYGATGETPIAVLRVKSTRTEYQRRGFLRIGALPMLVAEQVRLEVRDPQATAQLFTRLPEWLRAPGKGRAGELRDFQMFGRAEPDRPWLSAGRVRFAAEGRWELQAGEVREPGGAPRPFTQASLQVTGERAGEVQFPDGRTLNLFAPSQASSAGVGTAVAGPVIATIQPAIAQPNLATRINHNKTAP